MPGREPDGGQEILIEYLVQGDVVRVSAIHALTGTEAVIVAPASAPRHTLRDAATRKLAYIMAKKKGAE